MADPSASPGPRELPHLATFARAAERGSFTEAAADLGVTQAAVSQRIAALERELRVSLFNRRAGRIALTEAGERLYELARKILDLHEEARESLGGFHPSIAGDLPIAASSVPAECYLPALLSSFREKFPEVHVRASVGDSSSVMKEVMKGLATLGLVGKKAEKPNLESEAIGTDTLVLILAPGHPLASRKSISLAVLAREPLIIREPGSGHSLCLEEGARTGRVVARRDDDFARDGEQRGHQGCRPTRARGVVCLPLDGRTRALSGRAGLRPGSGPGPHAVPLRGLSPPSAALACGVGVPPIPEGESAQAR